MSTATASTITGSYTIGPTHSRIGFVARHAIVTKVRGSFNDFAGSGYFDAAEPTASHAEVTIPAASIDTRNGDRDAHLRSNEFFDMEQHPESAVDPYGNQRIGFEGATTLNRKDWGVNWNAALEPGGLLVSEKVTLEFEMSAIRTGDG
jgi:polyisoprenoid-binding protein YceI